MPTYDQEVLIDSPIAYWRLDEVLGTVLADSSGNGHHAILFISGAETGVMPQFGIPAPIETDPVNRAIAGGVGRAPTDAALDVTGNCALEVWGFNSQTPTSGTAVLLSRSNSAAGTAGTHLRINGQTITARIRITGTNYEVASDNQLPWGIWSHIVAVRNGAVLQLWVNAALVDERVDLPTDPIEMDGSWGLSADSADINSASSWGIARPAIYTSLSEARILAHYEAALNSLFINLVSNVIPSAVISSDFPTDPMSFPFRWNWAETPIERLAFRTDVSRARRGAEEGNGQRVTPRREFEFQQVLRNNAERRRLRALLWSKQHAIWFVPVRQDAEQLTAPLSATTTTIPISTAYKDYEVGGYIGLRQYDDSGNVVHWEEQLITAVTPVSVESGALVNNYDPYLSWVYPVRRALLTPNVSPQGITDTVETVTLTARLLPEDEAEVPRRLTVWSPTLKYRDYEVFDPLVWPSYNWEDEREYEVERTLDEIDFDTGRIAYDADTIGAAEATPYSVILSTRPAIAQFLGWFYERKGQLRYLWVPTMQSDFEVLAVDGDGLTVADTNYSDAFALAEPRRDLAFIYYDNSMEFRRVLSFSGTSNETLVLDAVVPTLTNLRSVSLLKFSRLDADQLEFAWETDSVVRVVWQFRELLHSPEGEGRSSLSPSHSASVSLSASHSPSPSASESPSPSASVSSSPSSSISISISPSPSASVSQSASVSPSGSVSASPSPSASTSPSSSNSPSVSPSASPSPSV